MDGWLGGTPLVVADWLGSVIGLVATLVLLLLVLAFAGFVYRSLTGGIEWPSDRDPDGDDEVRRSDDDDEWDYY